MAAEAQERRSMNKEVSLQVDAEPHTSVRDRLWARYRDDDLADRLSSVPWSDALDTMLSHRSIRSYLDKPIAPETLELLIAAAQSAPTTSNLQAWSVIAIRDPERKARLAAIAGNQRHVALHHSIPYRPLIGRTVARRAPGSAQREAPLRKKVLQDVATRQRGLVSNTRADCSVHSIARMFCSVWNVCIRRSYSARAPTGAGE
jgi:hypothetical protein